MSYAAMTINLAAIIITGIGIALGNALLTAASNESGIIVATYPMTMKIVIVSQVEFDKLSPAPALALAYPDRSPCEIYLPAGYRISTRYPADKWETYPARFIDPKVAGILAHEMMHCMHGAWHP